MWGNTIAIHNVFFQEKKYKAKLSANSIWKKTKIDKDNSEKKNKKKKTRRNYRRKHYCNQQIFLFFFKTTCKFLFFLKEVNREKGKKNVKLIKKN